MGQQRQLAALVFAAGMFLGAKALWAVDGPSFTPLTQQQLNDLVTAGGDAAFDEAFEHGDELFEIKFNQIDGGGAKVGQNWPNPGMIRFTRTPRAQLQGVGEWGKHFPSRATGPNAQACVSCHQAPFDGAGGIESNVHRDPNHTGNEFVFIQRNTPHLFAPGAVQNLAEDMTADLQTIRQTTITQACAAAVGSTRTNTLLSKGTNFGTLSATHTSGSGAGCVTSVSTTGVKGVDADLVVKPFQWKGSVAFLRDFVRGANHNELGMQAVEITGIGVDGDGDGIKNELSVGDISASSVYLAAQPRPTSLLELNSLGQLSPPLTSAQIAQINRGATAFSGASLNCASCHHPSKTLTNNIFSEPSQKATHRDGATFPGTGITPVSQNLLPSKAVKFDLTADQPDNVITNAQGGVVFRLGSLRKDGSGKGIVDLYSDLKRHDIGSEMGEPIDEAGTGSSVFLTETLWGVGTTGPYMHDGRAQTLSEAIKLHGGEAAASRTAFNALSSTGKDDLLAFLNNLVLHEVPGAGD